MVACALLRRDASLGAPSSHVASRGGRAWQRCRSAQPRSQLARHVRVDSVGSPRAAVDGADWRVRPRRWSRALSCAAMRRSGRRRHTSRLAVDERGRGVGRHSRGRSWRVTSEWTASARRALRSTALIGACALVDGRVRSLAPRCVARGAVVARRVSRWTSVAEVSVGTAAVAVGASRPSGQRQLAATAVDGADLRTCFRRKGERRATWHHGSATPNKAPPCVCARSASRLAPPHLSV